MRDWQYFTPGCEYKAPSTWKPSTREPNWTYDLQRAWVARQDREDNENILDEIEDEFNDFENEFVDDLPVNELSKEFQEIDDTVKGKKKFSMKFVKTALLTMRWIINTCFIGVPWVFLSIIFIVYNFVLNVWFNKWWAYGNFWLIFNTFYAIIQTILSWPLVFEIPSYLRHIKFIRWFSCLWALLYNTVWFGFMFGFIGQLYWATDEVMEQYSLMDMAVNMYLVYNCVIHVTIIPINSIIIFKEVTMTIFQLVTSNGPADYQLEWAQAIDDVENGLWFFDPERIVKKFQVWFKPRNENRKKRFEELEV